MNNLWFIFKSWTLNSYWTNITFNPISQVASISIANILCCTRFILVSNLTTKITVICRFNQWRDCLFLSRKGNFPTHIGNVIRIVHTNSKHSNKRKWDHEAINKTLYTMEMEIKLKYSLTEAEWWMNICNLFYNTFFCFSCCWCTWIFLII